MGQMGQVIVTIVVALAIYAGQRAIDEIFEPSTRH